MPIDSKCGSPTANWGQLLGSCRARTHAHTLTTSSLVASFLLGSKCWFETSKALSRLRAGYWRIIFSFMSQVGSGRLEMGQKGQMPWVQDLGAVTQCPPTPTCAPRISRRHQLLQRSEETCQISSDHQRSWRWGCCLDHHEVLQVIPLSPLMSFLWAGGAAVQGSQCLLQSEELNAPCSGVKQLTGSSLILRQGAWRS